MGTWGTGPFDNDVAADWAYEADEADNARAFVEETFATALATNPADGGDADMVIAAAAWLTGKVEGEAYGPTKAPPALDERLRDLAAGALRHILAEDSEWVELWADDLGEARAMVEALIDGLRRRE